MKREALLWIIMGAPAIYVLGFNKNIFEIIVVKWGGNSTSLYESTRLSLIYSGLFCYLFLFIVSLYYYAKTKKDLFYFRLILTATVSISNVLIFIVNDFL